MQLCTSPDHLNKTVVILAGYKQKMDRMMETTNPGIRRLVVQGEYCCDFLLLPIALSVSQCLLLVSRRFIHT